MINQEYSSGNTKNAQEQVDSVTQLVKDLTEQLRKVEDKTKYEAAGDFGESENSTH